MRRALIMLLMATGLAVTGVVSAEELSPADRTHFGLVEERASPAQETKFQGSGCTPDCAHERQAERNTMYR